MPMGPPANNKTSPQQVQQIIEQETGHGQTQVVSSTTETETVQGVKRPFEKRVVTQQNVKQLEYVGLLTGPHNQAGC